LINKQLLTSSRQRSIIKFVFYGLYFMHINKKNINKYSKKHSRKLNKKGYLRISNFLEIEFADKIFDCLTTTLEWDLACLIGSVPQTFKGVKNIDKLENEIQQKLISQTKQPFQFVYNTYMMVTGYIEKRNPGLYLNYVLEWLNSKETKDYFKILTQNDSLVKINAQATRYLPGHYLTQHNDENIDEGRIYAYVIGLSKNWNPDWGGLLHILDTKGEIKKTMIPEYNSLSIFKVPQNHFVSMVTPFAQEQRLAITGWLLSK